MGGRYSAIDRTAPPSLEVAPMNPRIGVAFSGGGFRATCFGLGCLRALHDKDLLRQVTVLSGISGGSLLAAAYAYGPEDYEDFDEQLVDLLLDGLQLEIATRSLHPGRVGRTILNSIRAVLMPGVRRPAQHGASRTDALRSTLESRLFGSRELSDVTHQNLSVVLTATDLRTSNAVRFGSTRSSCSPYGTIRQPITVAEAVAASGAFPFALPTVDRRYEFEDLRTGEVQVQDLLLTDGGVYDNLGLSVLEPRRSSDHTAHVYDLDYVIACDAGRGALKESWGRTLPFRLKRSADVSFRRAQDGLRARLHEFAEAGLIDGFVHAYLGMPDRRMPVPVADLVARDSVRDYPTNFRAMAWDDLNRIALRGEQLTRALLSHYCPQL
jgi:NTE family protein